MLLSVWVLYLHVCLWTTYVPGVHRGQKRVSDPLEMKLPAVVELWGTMWYWELNSGPLERASSSLNHRCITPVFTVCVCLIIFQNFLHTYKTFLSHLPSIPLLTISQLHVLSLFFKRLLARNKTSYRILLLFSLTAYGIQFIVALITG